MGQNCCVKDTTSTTETQVSYLGAAEGDVVPVPRLKNADVIPEVCKPQTSSEYGACVVDEAFDLPAENLNLRLETAQDEKADCLEVVPSPLFPSDDGYVSQNGFEFVAGTWYFVTNTKEAGTIKSDGFLTFHNGMTGQLCKAVDRSNAFTLTTQPDAIIEIVKDYEGQEQLHWTDGNFSAYWARSRPQPFEEYAGVWMRKHDAKIMARISGSGLVEWIHDGGPVNTKAPKRASLFTADSRNVDTSLPTSQTDSEVEPRAVFQFEAMSQRSSCGEVMIKMKSVNSDKDFTVVVTSKTELKFESSPLQGLIWTRKMTTDLAGGF